jgi:hypothetical protein
MARAGLSRLLLVLVMVVFDGGVCLSKKV